MGILHWLMSKTGMTREAQYAGTSSFERLEPRVLLSADLAGVQPVLASEAVCTEQAIYVGLESQSSEGQHGLSPIRTFDTSPALFVENQGQWPDPTVRYAHDGVGVDLAMTDTGIVFRATDAAVQMLQFSASFMGANAVRPVGLQPSASVFNYYLGDQANWRKNVSSYEVVAYEGLYEGVDLRIQGLRSHVKYEFHVAPGADYRQIAVRYEGIEGLSLGQEGSLQVNLGAQWGVIRDDAPYIYQEIDGQKVAVAGRFILLDEQTYSFEITGVVDQDHALVIDPDLLWSTYLGGNDNDWGSGVAVDDSGSLYVTGSTYSADWTSGGFDTVHANAYDAFVVKLSAAGQHLWSTYLGGETNDVSSGIAVDLAGNVYVTGTTSVTGGSTPPNWTSGGFDPIFSGNWDAFVVKLSSGGGHLWSTFLGGSGWEWGNGIAVDSLGNAYVTGTTDSSGWASGGFDTRVDGTDAFVAKISSNGASLFWSTYLGGTDWLAEQGYGIAVDSSGNVYVTGETASSGWVSGGFDTIYNGGAKDAFVAKLSSSGAHLWSTYLGGGESDVGLGIAVSASGNVYVTGSTTSFGWVSGGFDTTYGGGFGSGDAFAAKLSSSGAHLWSTYLGGTDNDKGASIAVDAAGNAYVIGYTASSGWTSGGFDTTYNGGSTDAFVARVSSDGVFLWSTYLGGADNDEGQGIAVDAAGNVYVAGGTYSAGWASGGFDTSFNGGSSDAFAVGIADPDTAPPTIDSFSVSPLSVELGGSFTVSYTVSDSGGSGLNRVELWRTDDPGSWLGPAVATNSASADDGVPVSGSFLDVPLLAGDWWYGLRVFDTAGNWTMETSPIHVVVDPARPPSPDPSTWETAPYATGATSVRMVATVATDPSGVQYYFREISGNPGATDSGWQDSNVYEDTGLVPGTTYTYQVRARDKSPKQNETQASDPRSATTDPDLTPPVISSFTISPPAAMLGGSFQIAYTVSDSGGSGLNSVQLWRIDSLSVSAFVAQNSASGNGPVTGYLSDIPPSVGDWWYEIRVFDASGNGTASTQPLHVVVTPLDTTPPSPSPSTWAAAPYATGIGSVFMVATPATDISGVEYYFDETSGNPGGTDSGWQDSNEYADTGLSAGTVYTYVVKTRDRSLAHNEGPYSTVASVTTPGPVYRFWSPVLQRHFYTIKEGEKNKLINQYADVWTPEGVAYYAFAGPTDPIAAPVYRFWSSSLKTHFYTIREGEKNKLINQYADVWTPEGVAFYTYTTGAHPQGTSAVFRFWSGSAHFYTISAAERNKLLNDPLQIWKYELEAWYAYPA